MDVFQIAGKLVLTGKEQFERDVNDTKKIGSELASGLGKALSTAAKVGTTAVAVAATAVGALAKASLDGYAEYEQLVGGSKLLFGDAYGYIAEQAQNAYKDVQMSQSEYLQQVNGFATGLKTALGGNEQEAAELAHRIIKAEADIVAATGNTKEAIQNAFNGIMKGNFTMLDNLQLGITPTKEGFQSLIKQVNEYNKSLGKATNYQIDNLADCQAALLDYVEMQGLSGYAAMEAADTITGSLSMTKAAWHDLLVGFARGNKDLDRLINNFVKSATTAAKKIVPKLAQILGGLSEALKEIIPVITEELPGLLEELLPGLISGTGALITGLIKALPGLLVVLKDALIQTIGGIWDYIAVDLLGSDYDFSKAFSDLSSAAQTVWEEIQEIWEDIGQPIWDSIQRCVEIVAETFEERMPEIEQFFEDFCGDMGTYWEETLQPCLKEIGDYIEVELAPAFEEVFGKIIPPLVDSCFEGVQKACSDVLMPALTGVTNFLTGTFTKDWEQAFSGLTDINDALNTMFNLPYIIVGGFVFDLLPEEVVQAGKQRLDAIEWWFIETTVSMELAWEDFTEFLSETFGDEIEWVQEKLGEIKLDFDEKVLGMQQGWESLANFFWTTLPEKMGKVHQYFDELKQKFEEKIEPMRQKWEEFTLDMSEKLAPVVATVTTRFNEIKTTITTSLNDVWAATTSTFENMNKDITEKIQAARDKVAEVIEEIKGFFEFEFSWPHLPLPHFSISPPGWKIGDLLEGSIPSLGIEWYAKGGILNSPTIFGMNGNNAMIGGEAGAEAVAPIETLQGYVAAAVASQNMMLVEALDRIHGAILSLDENMGGHLKDALDDTSFKVNSREFGRLVRGVT